MCLVVGERERFIGLDQFVRVRDRVCVGIDALPNCAGRVA
jgi:hypothetical protein